MVQPTSNKLFPNLLVVSWEFTNAHRKRLSPYFSNITYVPEGVPSSALLAEADVIFGIPTSKWLTSLSQVPRLKLIQIGSSGSDYLLDSPIWKEEGAKRIQLTNASGVAVGPIPQYFIATTLSLFHRLQQQALISHNEKRWATNDEISSGCWIFVEELRGKTVGILGYGQIGRESARLSTAFGARIIAANMTGQRTPQQGYIVPGTGDADGSIPEAWFSTTDPNSLASFLAQSDVVLLCLPSTPATHHILNAVTLSHMKRSAVIVNVGRGDAIDTDALVAALDGGKIAGAALDVTEPEPLPSGHTLFGRRNVILTPHMSGRTLRYYDVVVDILVENLERLKNGRKLVNTVDPLRGY